MRVQLWGEVPCQELDDSAILFFLKCVMEHLSVFREVIGLVFGAACLVAAAYLGDFTGYEFLGGGSCEIAVVCRAVWDSGNVSIDCFRVVVSAEGAVDGFFLGERMGPEVG